MESWILLHFSVLFMDPAILFQLTFTFIYSIFSKKFLVSVKLADPKQTLSERLKGNNQKSWGLRGAKSEKEKENVLVW